MTDSNVAPALGVGTLTQHGYFQEYQNTISLEEKVLAGLRPGQKGAVYAMRGWAIAPNDGVAILGLPTGYGKSELIALSPFIFGSRRTLVVVPSIIVRRQLANRILQQEHLRELGIIPDHLEARPRVREHVGRISESGDWKQFEAFDVVVSHMQSLSPAGGPLVDPPDPDLFDLILFDEAHHLGAPSWRGVRAAFPGAVAVGFTATPYRRDRRRLGGQTIFQYPIDRAVEDGFFVPIKYRLVPSDSSAQSRDKAVATEALDELARRDAKAGYHGARLLVRADTVERANQLAALYHQISPGVRLEVITHETTPNGLEAAIARLETGVSAGVAFVGVLGEGFDLPSLKIAAVHNPHRSLPVTIQFAGRVARTEKIVHAAPAGESSAVEEAVLIAATDDHPEILAELHKDGQRWDRLIPDLAKQFSDASVREWAAFSADTASMAAAFTYENFRVFKLADIYILVGRPNVDKVAAKLSGLIVTSRPESDEPVDGYPAEQTEPPRDSAQAIKVLRQGNCFAVLLARERQLPWLADTPTGQSNYAHIVVAIEENATEETWWLCVRSTLPPDLTSKALRQVFGASHLRTPNRAVLAKYRSHLWPRARFTGLGKRAIHPVVAGMLSYETGAGRGVDQALTLEDRALHEAGHAIGVITSGAGASIQIGIAIDNRRVWQTGYTRLTEYSEWAADICRDLEGRSAVGQLAGLRVADGVLSCKAQPIAALLDPKFDPNYDAEYSDGANLILFRDVELSTQRRKPGDDIRVALCVSDRVLTVIVYGADGQLIDAPGVFRRRGRDEELRDRLQRLPISIFFSDGTVLRGLGGCITPLGDGDYFTISETPATAVNGSYRLSGDNRFASLERSTTLLPEKDNDKIEGILSGLGSGVRAEPTSLFQFVVSSAVSEDADFVFCDDGPNEIADFIIGWRLLLPKGRPHLRLVHCKAMASVESRRLSLPGSVGVRNSGLKEAEEVCQQALRSVGFLLKPSEVMVDELSRRAQDRPARYVLGTADTIADVLHRDVTNRTSEIVLLHPGLSRSRLLQARGRPLRALLAATRARAVDAGADLAVYGRA